RAIVPGCNSCYVACNCCDDSCASVNSPYTTIPRYEEVSLHVYGNAGRKHACFSGRSAIAAEAELAVAGHGSDNPRSCVYAPYEVVRATTENLCIATINYKYIV